MRHLKAGRKLNRTSAHRKALMRNLATELLARERIQTTTAKAKELRPVTERLITLGKRGTLQARRQALRIVKTKAAMANLFGPLAERYATRPGGYTRIVRIGSRRGDNAEMAVIELVDTPVVPRGAEKGGGTGEKVKKRLAGLSRKKEAGGA
ncbi:MAG: 50S ribosomal protein L17 [bacterium]|jgi:large subunit ribosomal protein L17|nr:50S ribosomal protein L17 [bacterium]MDV2478996.1 50S ribosomal protein L17 [bacterium]